MNELEAELRLPRECVQWCRAQDYQLAVAEDIAPIDLDWWNKRLEVRKIPVRLWGRDLDGEPVGAGEAFLRRDDIATGSVPDQGPEDLCVLYRAAAWLSGHPTRRRPKRFIDVRTAGRRDSLELVSVGLGLCSTESIAVGDPYGDSSPWPDTPGVGPTVLSLYCWAVHPGAPRRPQLLDQGGVSTLCRFGWLMVPSASAFTRSRYLTYSHLLHRAADQAEVAAELIEMWLVRNWQERVQKAMHRSPTSGTSV
ncbi:MAG: hypothetical protein K0U76_08420 [Actinomycetia bacterium]|nr:hypothetical protein [Actinomycetes bacterium]